MTTRFSMRGRIACIVRLVGAEHGRRRRTAPCSRTTGTPRGSPRGRRSRSRCSASMLVTTAMVGVSRRNEPSDSSASATRNSPWPSRALVPSAVTRAAHDERRIEARLVQHRADHARSSSSCRGVPATAIAVLHPHQLGEHLGARDHRARRAGAPPELGVVARHRGRVDDHVRALDVGRRVAHVDLGAEPLRAARPRRCAGASDPVTRKPSVRMHLRRCPLMPQPPMPTKWTCW